MRLIIPIEYYRYGGVEKVIISLIRELSQQIEKVILVLPQKHISYFQRSIPPSDVVTYEIFRLPQESSGFPTIGILNKLVLLSKKVRWQKLEKFLNKQVNKQRSQAIVSYFANKHQATHCLYVLTNRLATPNLSIPLGMISHDMFWRFAPLTYADAYVEEYDRSLLEWLKTVNIVFTVSDKTRKDILSVFPKFADKIKTVPNAGLNLNEKKSIELDDREKTELQKNQTIQFYLPSSFGIYKDQLTLLKAGIQLAKKKLDFQIILTGKETDNLIDGKLTLSQQSQTQEYIDYFQECQQIYLANQQDFKRYFKGLGYVDEELVENYYQTCSCVVIPSKYEGFGLALAEAIVRGLPVICSDLEVFQEQVKLYQCSDRVEFFPQGNADALADCLERFILNPKPKLSPKESQNRFGHWTWQDAAKQYVKLFAELNPKST
jgi:glycosyltransferase involved in cell wall biosynthesis